MSYTIQEYPKVIGDGREHTNTKCSKVQISFQDDGRTIKVFLVNDEVPETDS
jgi:hypothetical protein